MTEGAAGFAAEQLEGVYEIVISYYFLILLLEECIRVRSWGVKEHRTTRVKGKKKRTSPAFFFCGMSDDPVEYASASLTNPNSKLLYIIKSSAHLDTFSISKLPHCIVSTTKSLSATAFIELGSRPSKPSSCAMAARSMPKGLPARAPQPRGEQFTRAVTSRRRVRSEARAVAWERSQWEKRTGWAFWRWV